MEYKLFYILDKIKGIRYLEVEEEDYKCGLLNDMFDEIMKDSNVIGIYEDCCNWGVFNPIRER